METAEDRHKSLHSTTSTSSNCVDSPQSPDLLENCQGDAVFVETQVPRPGPWSSKCYKYVKENMLLSIATIMLVVCLVGNWILMDVLTRSFLQDIKQGLILREKTSSDWTRPNVHSYISLYLFKISEPDDHILSVSEVGPYVYRVNMEKVSVTWHSNSTVSYRERYALFYDPAKSVAEEVSHVTNLAFVILFQQNDSVSPMLNVYTGESDFSKIYQTYSCNYTTNMSVWNSENGNNKITGTDGSMFQPCLTEHAQLTLFYPQLLRTFELRYSSLTTFKDLPVYRYIVPDSAFVNSTCSCRTPGNNTGASPRAGGANCTLPGVYSVSTQMNVPFGDSFSSWTHSVIKRTLTHTGLPVTHGLCDRYGCLNYISLEVEQGIWDLSCWLGIQDGIYRDIRMVKPLGAVLHISLPHFLGADPYYHQLVKGLYPQEAKHRPIFDVDKVTGKTVRQKRRFQVNMHQVSEQGQEVYLPLYWAELSQEVNDNDLQSMQKASEYLETINVTCLCVGLSLGLLLTAVLSILVYKAVKRRSLPNQYKQLHPRPGRQCCIQL